MTEENESKYLRRERREGERRTEKFEAEQKKLGVERKKHTKQKKILNPNGKQLKRFTRLKDGSIILSQNFKIGRTGMIVFAIIGVLAVVSYMGVNGMLDEYLPIVLPAVPPAVDMNDNKEIRITDDINYEEGVGYTVNDKDGIKKKDSSGNTIIFNSHATATEFLKRITVNLYDLLNGNFFFPEANAVERNHFTIGISQSTSCKTSIKKGIDKCVTNKILFDNFDNTITKQSGDFIWSDIDNDIYRKSPQVKDHQNIYQYLGIKTVIAVDPDSTWYRCCMDARIIIEPTNFVYFDLGLGSKSKYNTGVWNTTTDQKIVLETKKKTDTSTDAKPVPRKGCGFVVKVCPPLVPLEKVDKKINTTVNKLTHYKNVYIDGCSFARVASNMTLIKQVVEYFTNGCTGVSPVVVEYVYPVFTPIDHSQHKYYKYAEWLKIQKELCKKKC